VGRMSRSMGNHNMGNGGMKGGQSVMSQSQGKLLTNSNTSSGLSQSILSDPCLLKSPTPSLPSLLSSDLARQQDMNANQSLWFFLLLSELLLMHSNMWYLVPVQWCDCSSDRNQLLWCDISSFKAITQLLCSMKLPALLWFVGWYMKSILAPEGVLCIEAS